MDFKNPWIERPGELIRQTVKVTDLLKGSRKRVMKLAAIWKGYWFTEQLAKAADEVSSLIQDWGSTQEKAIAKTIDRSQPICNPEFVQLRNKTQRSDRPIKRTGAGFEDGKTNVMKHEKPTKRDKLTKHENADVAWKAGEV